MIDPRALLLLRYLLPLSIGMALGALAVGILLAP